MDSVRTRRLTVAWLAVLAGFIVLAAWAPAADARPRDKEFFRWLCMEGRGTYTEVPGGYYACDYPNGWWISCGPEGGCISPPYP